MELVLVRGLRDAVGDDKVKSWRMYKLDEGDLLIGCLLLLGGDTDPQGGFHRQSFPVNASYKLPVQMDSNTWVSLGISIAGIAAMLGISWLQNRSAERRLRLEHDRTDSRINDERQLQVEATEKRKRAQLTELYLQKVDLYISTVTQDLTTYNVVQTTSNESIVADLIGLGHQRSLLHSLVTAKAAAGVADESGVLLREVNALWEVVNNLSKALAAAGGDSMNIDELRRLKSDADAAMA